MTKVDFQKLLETLGIVLTDVELTIVGEQFCDGRTKLLRVNRFFEYLDSVSQEESMQLGIKAGASSSISSIQTWLVPPSLGWQRMLWKERGSQHRS